MAQFTPGELEVMQVLWEHGTLKPGDIQTNFPRPIRNAALRSVLLVLMEKGHVVRRRRGKAFYYRAKTPRAGALKKMTRRKAETISGGSAAALIARLIETEDLSPEELRYLKDVAAGQARGKTSSGPRGGKR